jgi:hypothetical protein
MKKKSAKHILNIIGAPHKKMDKNVRSLNSKAGGSFGAPIIDKNNFISVDWLHPLSPVITSPIGGPNSLVRLAYCHANHLLTRL